MLKLFIFTVVLFLVMIILLKLYMQSRCIRIIDGGSEPNEINQIKIDNIIKSIQEQIYNECVIKEINLNTFIKSNFSKKDHKLPLVLFKISDGDVKLILPEFSKYFDEKLDDRIISYENMLKNTISKYPIKNCVLPFFISDRIPYEYTMKIPLIVHAKPRNTYYPIFPDNTFLNISINKKYGLHSYDWDKMKQIISDYKVKHKINKIYFKGTPTGQRRGDLRRLLLENKPNNMIIKLDAWKDFEPIYKWKKYKAVINLPGHYDWSNRFKYLFLLDSVIINVNTIYHYKYDIEYIDEPYMSFIDYFVKQDVDYYNITVELYDETIDDYASKNLKNIIDLRDKIEMINLDDPKLIKINKNANTVVESLGLDDVYYYVFKMCEILSAYTYTLDGKQI